MKAVWDPKVDAIYFELSRAKAVDSEEIRPGVIIDYGRNDKIVGIEILNFSKNFKRMMLVDSLRKESTPVNLESVHSKPRSRRTTTSGRAPRPRS